MLEIFSEIITSVNSNPILTALATIASILGSGLIAAAVGLRNISRARAALGQSNIALSRELADKTAAIRSLEQLLARKNADMEVFMGIFPKTKAASHILLHELFHSGRYAIEIKDAASSSPNEHVEKYTGRPLIEEFLQGCASLLASRD